MTVNNLNIDRGVNFQPVPMLVLPIFPIKDPLLLIRAGNLLWKGENNEEFVGCGEGGDSPYIHMEKTHIIALIKRKRNISKKSARNS